MKLLLLLQHREANIYICGYGLSTKTIWHFVFCFLGACPSLWASTRCTKRWNSLPPTFLTPKRTPRLPRVHPWKTAHCYRPSCLPTWVPTPPRASRHIDGLTYTSFTPSRVHLFSIKSSTALTSMVAGYSYQCAHPVPIIGLILSQARLSDVS